jgi:phospholipid/cholesterol/gamma-HCH transport system ATP-binding protein
MIRLENINTSCFKALSLELEAGTFYKVLTTTELDRADLITAILGNNKPINGSVFLFDQDVYSIGDKALLDLLKDVGIVRHGGGLISNLKVWENILLPLWYHNRSVNQDTEVRITDLCRLLDIGQTNLEDYMGELPGHLPVYERTLIGFIRSALMEPSLMIYDAVCEDIDTDRSRRLYALIKDYHVQREKRTSIYFSSDTEASRQIKADMVFVQKDHGFDVCQY